MKEIPISGRLTLDDVGTTKYIYFGEPGDPARTFIEMGITIEGSNDTLFIFQPHIPRTRVIQGNLITEFMKCHKK